MGTGNGRSGDRKRDAGGDVGILGRVIAETPVAVLDFETTGLTPGGDRVVEVSVVRVDPGGGPPRLVLDSLVNPGRPMGATEVHGIRDADVRSAPRFHEISDELVRATAGCVVAAYNAYFDMRFLSLSWVWRGCGKCLRFFA
ncbi:MAG: exonuclease domain-containing protein [Planctomycetaceae bacterium]